MPYQEHVVFIQIQTYDLEPDNPPAEAKPSDVMTIELCVFDGVDDAKKFGEAVEKLVRAAQVIGEITAPEQ